MKEIRLGTIGSGNIVRSILDSVVQTSGFHLEAVYSRTQQAGSKLAQSYNVSKVYTDLNAFLADDTINCIYVASPNFLHYTHVKMALQAGKHVICEKPFTPKYAQARELIELAREKGLMLVDATPTAYIPNLGLLRQQLDKIGRVRIVMTNFSQYSSRYDNLLEDKVGNVFNPEYCGGCLMDINYYNLFINIALFGKPEHAVYYPNRWKNGIDTSGVLVMQYPDFISTNVGAKDTWGDNFLVIEGEKGHIHTQTSNWLKQLHVVTKTTDEVLSLQEPGTNYLYEIQAIAALLLQEDHQALHRYQQTTLDVMEVLESARIGAGILFPVDCE